MFCQNLKLIPSSHTAPGPHPNIVLSYKSGVNLTFHSTHSCSSWGESFFIAIQVCILLAQMFYYNKQMICMSVFWPVYGVAIWFLTSNFASIELLSMLQACVIPLLLTSRVCVYLIMYTVNLGIFIVKIFS